MADAKTLYGGIRRYDFEPGRAPGTFAVREGAKPSVVHAIAWGPDGVDEREIADLDELSATLASQQVTWVNVDGLGDERVIRRLGEIFGLHPLVLEDIVTPGQRPKVERYERNTFVVARAVDIKDDLIVTEQMNVVFGDRFVLTIQEEPGDPLDPVRRRIREGSSDIRAAGSDYLAYAILDAIVDYYFPVLERYDDLIEDLGGDVLARSDRELVGRIFTLRRDLLALRRAAWPMREAINDLRRNSGDRIGEVTRTYLLDTYDHLVHAIEILEVYHELVASFMDVYVSNVSNRMNEIMKVLTIIATIFIPLSVITGVYGMNFDARVSPLNMPELEWYWGYPAVLGLMAAVAGLMLWWFKRKGWW